MVVRRRVMRPAIRKLLLVTVPVVCGATLAAMVIVEAWVRVSWDERRGRPGFYISDPVLGQRLAPGYDGWFAGVPVRINQLGFRDDRDYTIEKAPGTFRILVLGDSVTFGHGTLFQTTYPYLLETRLRAWRPDVDWQVWNLGVPGYNTEIELRQLSSVGPRFAPDLVIVGFYPNDFIDNQRAPSPGVLARARSGVQGVMQRYLYSYEFYKRAALTLRWRLFTSSADRQRLEALAGDEQLLLRGGSAAPEQALTDVDYFDEEAIRTFVCDPLAPPPDPNRDRLSRRLGSDDAEMTAWRESLAALQQLHRDGRYRLVFFINMSPTPCVGKDRFYDEGALEDDDALRAALGAGGVPVTSSTRAYLHHRPSQMPGAGGHSVGNANRVKADVLFDFLKAKVLPALLPAKP